MPLWLLLIGQLITDQSEDDSSRIRPATNLETPYFEIIKQILFFLLPTILGILIRQFIPKVAKFIKKIFRPYALLTLLIIFPLMIYIHWHLLKIFIIYWFCFPIVAALPYFGFLFGFLVPLCLRMSKRDAMTISFETGIQNIGIAIFIMKFSMPHPEGDIGLVFCMIEFIVSPLPIYIIVIIRCIIKGTCCTKFEALKKAIKSKFGPKGIQEDEEVPMQDSIRDSSRLNETLNENTNSGNVEFSTSSGSSSFQNSISRPLIDNPISEQTENLIANGSLTTHV